MKLDAKVSTSEKTPTEVFVPLIHFPLDDMDVQVTGGKWSFDAETQYIKWWHMEGEQTMKVVGPKGLGQQCEDDTYLDLVKSYSCAVM